MNENFNRKPAFDNNFIVLAGEFAVLSQWSLRGYDANLTLGHTKGIDILVSDPESGKMFKMEMKTVYGKNTVKSELFSCNLEWGRWSRIIERK